jgi:DNA replication protein
MTGESYLKGFPQGDSQQVIFPPAYYSDYLPEIDDLDELKLNLIILWAFSLEKDREQLFSYENLINDEKVMKIFRGDTARIKTAIEKSLTRGSLLKMPDPENSKECYMLNTPYSRAVIEEVKSGKIRLDDLYQRDALFLQESSNIFRLYEENIGAITPMVAEILKEDEKQYPLTWIKEAIEIAVKRNARNWKYVQTILDAWQKEGRDGKGKKDSQRVRDQYREKWLGKSGRS